MKTPLGKNRARQLNGFPPGSPTESSCSPRSGSKSTLSSESTVLTPRPRRLSSGNLGSVRRRSGRISTRNVIEGSVYGGSVLGGAVVAAVVGVTVKMRMELVALLAFGVAIVAATIALVQFLMFPIAEFVGWGASRRRVARQLRKAQEKCNKLLKEAKDSMDDTAPVEHLRAAALHLRMVEGWLLNNSNGHGNCPNSLSRCGRASIIQRELQLPRDVEHSEHEAEFRELFDPLVAGEAFAIALHCHIQSGTFRHHGKLYLSSARICLHSSFLGAKILFSGSWNDVAQVRLTDTDGSRAYHICFYFKKDVELDGMSIKQLHVIIFDLLAVGHMDRCATYFTGSGLFGFLQNEDDHREIRAGIASLESNVSLQNVDEYQEPSVVWQCERRSTIFQRDWKAPFLPHDGQKKMKWVSIQDCYMKHPFVPTSVSPEAMKKSQEPPIREINMLGEIRPCSWSVVVGEPHTDEDGWQYAADFYLSPEYWHEVASWSNFAHVRRRKWRPVFTEVDRDVQKTKSATFLAEKKLTPQMVFEENLGPFPLEKLSFTFQEDDWKAGGLMAKYFEDVLGALSLEVSPWVTGEGTFAQLEGSVRSVEMKISVAGKPMCPPETRCTSTWHVVVKPTSVMLESVVMTLDVPFGMYFNTVTCDTFTVDEKGEVQYVRTCAIDWIKSTWLKRTIETAIPKEVREAAQKWASILKNWDPENNCSG